MMIKIVEIIGKHCSNRIGTKTQAGGVDVRNLIENSWEKESEIEISFEDVETATPSFLDEAFGKLVLNHSFTDVKSKLRFNITDPTIKNRINENIVLRLKQVQEQGLI